MQKYRSQIIFWRIVVGALLLISPAFRYNSPEMSASASFAERTAQFAVVAVAAWLLGTGIFPERAKLFRLSAHK
jgi:hypothetical protein